MARSRKLGLSTNRWWLAGALGAVLVAACGGDDQPAGIGAPHVDSGGSSDGNASDGTVGADAQTDATTSDAKPSDGGTLSDVIADSAAGRDSEGGDNMPDAKPPDDAFVLPDSGGCGTKVPYTTGVGGTCTVGQTYTCMGDNYQIDCACPASTCTCTKNGAVAGTVQLFGGCPSCTAPDYRYIAFNCPVPY